MSKTAAKVRTQRPPRRAAVQNPTGALRAYESDAGASYVAPPPLTADETAILAHAESILAEQFKRLATIADRKAAAAFLRMRLAGLDHEELHIVWLDRKHRVIATERLASGTIDGAEIHPREVVRAALRTNAVATILAHNHPSGDATPSAIDCQVTLRIRDALDLIGVRVLDHIIVGAGEPVSGAMLGWLD